MGFLYETHLHTCEASACGKVHGEDYIPYMMEKGYAGIIVTDHFFNGNTCVPEDLPWKERVEIYCSGIEGRRGQGFQCHVRRRIQFLEGRISSLWNR